MLPLSHASLVRHKFKKDLQKVVMFYLIRSHPFQSALKFNSIVA